QPAATLPAAKIEIAQSRPPAEESTPTLSKAVPMPGDRTSVASALQNRRRMPASKSAASIPLNGRSEAVTVESQSAQLSAKTQDSTDARIAGLTGGVAP